MPGKGRATGYTDFYKQTSQEAPKRGSSVNLAGRKDTDTDENDTRKLRKSAIQRRLKALRERQK